MFIVVTGLPYDIVNDQQRVHVIIMRFLNVVSFRARTRKKYRMSSDTIAEEKRRPLDDRCPLRVFYVTHSSGLLLCITHVRRVERMTHFSFVVYPNTNWIRLKWYANWTTLIVSNTRVYWNLIKHRHYIIDFDKYTLIRTCIVLCVTTSFLLSSVNTMTFYELSIINNIRHFIICVYIYIYVYY